ncbi:MAG: MMPL family transporter [Chitinophagales bacterium]|nr:MMPL family transporter [Chitinophagales bacterium]
MNLFNFRKQIIALVALLCLVALFFSSKLLFVFDLERFFPQGDEDLAYFYEFRKEFEDDDNFLLVAFTDSHSIFKRNLLLEIDSFTTKSLALDEVVQANSITNFQYFVKLQFGGFSPPFPALHLEEGRDLAKDSLKLVQDERIYGKLLAKDCKSTVVVLKTKNALNQKDSESLMKNLYALLDKVPEENYHLLGRAYFQDVLVKQQIKEFILSTLISAFLVSLVFWIILRKSIGVFIAILSMLVCLLLFVGLLGAFQIELDMLSSLFPIIMIIVGVSDVVHLTNKYIEEYLKLGDQKQAIKTTVKEIGLATFLTSFTTAIGFLSLATSRIYPVKSFGISAALGVLVAFAVVICFTTAMLALIPPEKIIRRDESHQIWKNTLLKFYLWTKGQSKSISIGAFIYFAVCLIGISLISTDVKIYDTLPRGVKLTEDFRFFEENYAGFRPFELAIEAQNGLKMDNYPLLYEIHKIEEFLKQEEAIEGINSITVLYKTLNRAMNADKASFYSFPSSESEFLKIQKYAEKIPTNFSDVLLNKDKSKARISAKVKDIGSNQVDLISERLHQFITEEIDSSLIKVKLTGTGVIFDKNNEYIRQSLLSGLALAFFAISIIMALLFKDIKMVIISLIPNVFPLLFGGALMGYFNIALDAPTAIIFAISFGIAVDDTIHFLSKFKLERLKNKSIEEALKTSFLETGKAIIITSIILFFGFLILLFSKTPGIVFVGVLVSGTLLTAVISDLLLLPLLIRKLL